MKRIAIVQSNYIPWKGYFDLIASVDEFVLYDDVQFTRRDWRNRNLIKTPQGTQWLTVPVKVKGRFSQSIRETEIDGDRWAEEHWTAIQRNYAKASHFKEFAGELAKLYAMPRRMLTELNRDFIDWASKKLGISTRITSSDRYLLSEGKSERLADVCVQAGASEYVSGPAARAYLDEEAFRRRGVAVTWFEYSGYPEYPQLWGPFVHEVSIIDLLLNCGTEAGRYMKFVR